MAWVSKGYRYVGVVGEACNNIRLDVRAALRMRNDTRGPVMGILVEDERTNHLLILRRSRYRRRH